MASITYGIATLWLTDKSGTVRGPLLRKNALTNMLRGNDSLTMLLPGDELKKQFETFRGRRVMSLAYDNASHGLLQANLLELTKADLRLIMDKLRHEAAEDFYLPRVRIASDSQLYTALYDVSGGTSEWQGRCLDRAMDVSNLEFELSALNEKGINISEWDIYKWILRWFSL